MGHALDRMLGVDRYVGRARAHDRVHHHEHVDRAQRTEPDDGLRTGTFRDELASQAVHPRTQLGVGQGLTLEPHGDGVGGGGDAGGEHVVEGFGRDHLVGGVACGQQQVALGGREQVEFADAHVRGVDQGAQDLVERRQEAGGGGVVEEVERVVQMHIDAVRGAVGGVAVGQRPVQIELDRRGIHLERGDGESVEPQIGLGLVLQRQCDLIERGVGLGTHRVQGVDQLLERDVGVLEGGHVDCPDLGEQFGRGGVRAHLGPQDKGVDEHADQIVERLITATGHRGADHDVVGAGQAREQRRQRGVQHHERGGAMIGGELLDAPMQCRVEAGGAGGATVGGNGGARAVRRESDHIGEAGEAVGPVRELLGQDGIRVIRAAEGLALPECEIGVLEWERGEFRCGAGGTREVGEGQIAGERGEGPAVGGDVVDDEQQDVGVGVVGCLLGHPQQLDAERHLAGHVETGLGGGCHKLRQLGGRDRARLEGQRVGGGEHELRCGAVVFRVDGTQGFVASDDVVDGGAQGRHIERAGEPQREGDVVAGAVGVEAVEEPHALLGDRQRDGGGAVLSRQRRAGGRSVRGVRLDQARQLTHRRRIEHRAHRNPRARRLAEARGELGGDERIAAEPEEVVTRADLLHAEQRGEDLGHKGFRRSCRRDELHGRYSRGRQRLAVQLAGGVHGQRVEHDEAARDHVRGERAGEFGAEGVGIEKVGARGSGRHRAIERRAGRRGGRVGHQIRHELWPGPVVVAHQNHCLGDRREGQQRSLHFAQFDAQAAHLHLEVGAAEEVQFTVGGPGHEIAGAVHAGAGGAEGVGEEAVGGQVRAGEVAVGELGAGQVQLAGNTCGDGAQAGVEDVGLAVPHRAADGQHGVVGVGHLVGGDLHGRLGGAVHVVHAGAGQRAGAVGDGGGQGFTGAEDVAQGGDVLLLGDERGQHRRHEMRDGDGFTAHQIGQVDRVAMAVRLGEHHARADLQGPEELRHRDIEGGGSLLEQRVGGVDGHVGRLHPAQPVDDGAVIHRHPLGAAGGAGGEQHVGGVGGP
ncbi:hypothetical protein FMUBM48_49430 [Nocardia cyriacigeorgica]|nr:hypothetical protein FMUBM48_49430 [Nocardia cyriacigeorgica]